MKNRPWTRDELILALHVYFQLPFGLLHHGTPEVKELARIIDRTDNSAAMRLSNYAACDPAVIGSGRTGLVRGLSKCKPIWDEFAHDRKRLSSEAMRIKADLLAKTAK